jgi:hypothetical protein
MDHEILVKEFRQTTKIFKQRTYFIVDAISL